MSTLSNQQLYLMENSVGLFKIGISVSPQRRLAEIKNSSGLVVKLLAVWETEEDAFTVEQRLHKKFKSQRKHGEWFENLSVGLIESSETLREGKIDLKTHRTKKPVLKKIKCVQLSSNVLPICELILQNKLETSMKVVVRDKVEFDALGKEQEFIATTLLRLKYNRVQHQEWATELLNNNIIYQPNYMGYTPIRVTRCAFINCVQQRQFHSAVSFPWANTADSAKSIKEIRIQEWMKDIKEAEERFDCMLSSLDFN